MLCTYLAIAFLALVFSQDIKSKNEVKKIRVPLARIVY